MGAVKKHDKKTWGPGPWQDEPDRIEFKAAGLPCIVLRGPMGSLCGYVGLPSGHPWYGRGYDDIDDVQVHGGLTYAAPCNDHVCHKPAPGEPDKTWWIGFDAAHAWDFSPGLQARLNQLVPETDDDARSFLFRTNDVYRDLSYMRQQCICLAAQAQAAVESDRREQAASEDHGVVIRKLWV